MLQQDSIIQETAPAPEDIAVHKSFKPRHPYQVLRMLPKDATPAQQDSAIQATFQPKEIHYSNRPDTLHIPGHEVGKSIREVKLPQYYREIFFSKDSLLHPELNGGRYGVAGDPVPYTLRTDNMITGLLLGCLVLALVSFANSRRFILRQIKDFFYINYSENSITETSNEVRFQFFLVLQTCLQLAILGYFYVNHTIADTFVLDSQYHLIGIYFLLMVAYYAIVATFTTIVNIVFFDSKKNKHWLKQKLFLTAIEGVLLFPVVLLQVYFDLSMQSVVYYFFFVLILVKLLSFYKCYTIFFRLKGVFLQIILYFCALEITPLLALWSAMVLIGNLLKVNY